MTELNFVVEFPLKQRSSRFRKTPVFLPPFRATVMSETGSWGAFNTRDWICLRFTIEVFVETFTWTRPRKSSSRPGSEVAVCWNR